MDPPSSRTLHEPNAVRVSIIGEKRGVGQSHLLLADRFAIRTPATASQIRPDKGSLQAVGSQAGAGRSAPMTCPAAPEKTPISSASPANSVGSRPRNTERLPQTSTTRRRTQRRALEKSAASGHHFRAAALMPRCSANAATSSAHDNGPGSRADKQSGSALKVVWHLRQYQRATRIPAGSLRSYVP